MFFCFNRTHLLSLLLYPFPLHVEEQRSEHLYDYLSTFPESIPTLGQRWPNVRTSISLILAANIGLTAFWLAEVTLTQHRQATGKKILLIV